MTRYATNLARTVGQQQPIPGREAEMSRNDAGGYGFTLTHWDRFKRFLILGAEGGTFYVGEQKLTVENAAAAMQCIKEDGLRALSEIARVHNLSLAPKWEPAVFCLALASVHGDVATKTRVAAMAPDLLRTGAQLLAFVASADALGKWRRNLRRTVQAWVDARPADQLAYQAVKYQQRNGWSLRDVLRLSHATSKDPAVKAVLDRICGRAASASITKIPEILVAEGLMRFEVNEAGVEAALRYADQLPREALPSEVNKLPGYWKQALATGNLPATALIRNLAQMTRVGLMDDVEVRDAIIQRIAGVTKARVHPLAVLLAAAAYKSGGANGRSQGAQYAPNQAVLDALYMAFETGFTQEHRIAGSALVAVDVSGSMSDPVNGSPALTCRDAATAIAVALSRVVEAPEIQAFNQHCPATGHTGNFWGRVKAGSSYSEALEIFGRMNGSTNCASPILYATQAQKAFDAIVIVSDQDSWSGHVHVAQAMEKYRAAVNPKARLVVLGLAGTGTTLVDPKDPLALGIAGFDAGAVTVLESFLRGAL
jgi:60 kDa SS-A/Ro ribonucleoprotein